jgi:hypothetical protein
VGDVNSLANSGIADAVDVLTFHSCAPRESSGRQGTIVRVRACGPGD